MSYVITEKCLGERYATRVEVCPVDCIHPGEYEHDGDYGNEFMVIDPKEGSNVAGLAEIEKFYVDLLYALAEAE